MKILDKNMFLVDLIETEKYITYAKTSETMKANNKLSQVKSIPSSKSESGEWEYLLADAEQEVEFLYKRYNIWGEYRSEQVIRFKFSDVGTEKETFMFQLDDKQPIILNVKVKDGMSYQVRKTYIGNTDGARGLFSLFMGEYNFEYLMHIITGYYENYIDSRTA